MITGKKIVLTGANSGIGLETLKLLVQGNNKILAVDLKTDVISTFDQSKVFPMQCDVGNKEGYMETSIQYGLRHPETKDALRKYIIDLGKKLESEGKKKPAGK